MTAEPVADRRLHPATFLIRAIKSLPQYVVGLPAIVGWASDVGLAYLFLLALAGIGLSVLAAWLHWTRFRYGLGPAEIVIESGILHRQRRIIPFDRIQDIDIEQGPLARMFGTAKVKIETGGAAKNEGDLDSVALGEAHRLREVLRRGRAGTSTVEEQAEPAEEPLLFDMKPGRVVLAGLFNFSLFYLAFIFGGLEYVEALFGFDPLKMDWVEPVRSLAAQASWGLSLLAAALVLSLGVFAGVLRTLARDYNFRLTRAEGGLRRRRGLFTLSEVVIPFRRIQLSLIQAGPAMRAFGWHRLEFQTLNADAAKAGHQVAVPFGRMEEALRVLEEVRPSLPPPDEDFTRVSKRHIVRQAIRWMLILVPQFVIAGFFWRPAFALLLLIPFIAIAAALEWRHHRFCLAPDALYVRQGWFTRRLWILPYERIQTIGLLHGPLQRRLGLATVAPDTAGASMFRSPHIANLPAADAAALGARLLDAHKDARERLRLPRTPE